MAMVVDGKLLRDQILEQLKKEIEQKKLRPRLAILLVGEDEASLRYIKQKINMGERIGARVDLFQFPLAVSQEEIEGKINLLNQDETVHGIVVQLPLPHQIDIYKITQAVKPEKDVDGLNEESTFQPATPLAVLEILRSFEVPIKGKTAVVFGRSRLVGAPLKAILEGEGAQVIQIHSQTPTPVNHLSLQGDIVVSAVGKAQLVTAGMVKPDAVVIDVGISADSETGKLIGDVDFEHVKDKASVISPVPGGVGPMTVAMLLKNLVKASSI